MNWYVKNLSGSGRSTIDYKVILYGLFFYEINKKRYNLAFDKKNNKTRYYPFNLYLLLLR